MKLLMTVFTSTILMGALLTLKNNVQRIQCQWEKMNKRHQMNILRRTDSYLISPQKKLNYCLQNSGQTTFLFLFICLLGFSFIWLSFSQILLIRKDILEREKNLSCTAWLETKALMVNNKIQTLNSFIKKARLIEMGTQITPALSRAIKAQIILLQGKQQMLVSHYLLSKKNLFPDCKILNSHHLLLFQTEWGILKRDIVWKTANQIIMGSSLIKVSKFKMYLRFERKIDQILTKRFFHEGLT
jgi:hypothetical protein